MAPNDSPPDLGRIFCDVVMKGGITSGVVYPTAIAGLAKRYRLRNIGGASAGAIAAGAAAAAEHARQKHGTDAGFRRLETLAKELGEPPRGDPRGGSLLFRLFAPTRLSRPLFDLLAGMLNRKTPSRRLAFGLLALVSTFPGTFVVGAALLAGLAAALVPAVHPVLGLLAIVAILPGIAAVSLGLAVWRALRHLALVMARQDFGLCTGMREGDGPPALTQWLHGVIQEIAGEPRGTPLTFGDLRRLRFAETPGQDGVVLRMMTTCLTLGRPYTLPIEERLYFDPIELAAYFPADVVQWMKDQSSRPRGREETDEDALAAAHAVNGAPRPLFPIPEPDDFPVVVGVRMSLSFPLLVSAIPLHRYAFRKEDGGGATFMERLVFTDGGVCSNLPIHLFDSPVPPWPTFALNLRDDLEPGAPDADRVVAPKRGRSYQGDRYAVSSDEDLGAVATFLAAIVNTMQNWRDMLQRAAPGARERVFTVRHRTNEGGLNLNMEKRAIDTMAASGAAAAEAMKGAFLAPAGTPPGDDDWQYHRWVRLRLLLPALGEFLGHLDGAMAGPGAPPSIRDFLTGAPPPMGRSYEMNQVSRAAAWTFLDALDRASRQLRASEADLERTKPRPAGELRVMPRF